MFKNNLKALGGFFISGKVLCALSILNGVFGLTGYFRGISMGISVVLMCICIVQLIINKKKIRDIEHKMYSNLVFHIKKDVIGNYIVEYKCNNNVLNFWPSLNICKRETGLDEFVYDENNLPIYTRFYLEDKEITFKQYIEFVDPTYFIKQNLLNDIKKLKGI